jgi:hypothetical protein
MRLYRITTSAELSSPTVRWAASKAEAASIRQSMCTDGASRASINTEEIDVPTDKVGLLRFLNARRA